MERLQLHLLIKWDPLCYAIQVFESSTHQEVNLNMRQMECNFFENIGCMLFKQPWIMYREDATKLYSYRSVIRMEMLLDVDGPVDMMSAGMLATIWKKEPLWILSNVSTMKYFKM